MFTDSIYCAVKVCCVLFSPFTVEESVVGLVPFFCGSLGFPHSSSLQSSILGHLLNLRLLRSETAFVEFGAGRGKLSHWIQAAIGEDPSIKYILVDRSNCRRKVNMHYGSR